MNKFDQFLENSQLLKDKFNVTPLLYGSLGLEVLTNVDLKSDDIDILIPNIYLSDKWIEFKGFLEENSYQLIDLHEHTFLKDGIAFSYASIENLNEFAGISINEITCYEGYLLLNLRQYLKVYQTSLKDGYRIYNKNKKDQEKIDWILSCLVRLVKPTYEELSFKQAMLADKETMAYNHRFGGTIDFSIDKWPLWYKRWVQNDDPHFYYRYLYSHELKCFVGEIAYHYEENTQRYICDVIIYAKYRGCGFGGFGLDLLCRSAKENGISVIYDEILLDNPSIHFFVKHGFEIIEKTSEVFVVRKELN